VKESFIAIYYHRKSIKKSLKIRNRVELFVVVIRSRYRSHSHKIVKGALNPLKGH